jgi:hypothetical protein
MTKYVLMIIFVIASTISLVMQGRHVLAISLWIIGLGLSFIMENWESGREERELKKYRKILQEGRINHALNKSREKSKNHSI